MTFPEHPHGYLFGNVSWNVPVLLQIHKLNAVHHLMQRSIYTQVDGQEVGGSPVPDQGIPMEVEIAGKRCSVRSGRDGNVFSYTLEINGDSFERYKRKYQRMFEMWKLNIDGQDWVVVIEKQTMQVFGNGEILATETGFQGEGTVITFTLGQTPCQIEASGASMNDLNCVFFKNNEIVPSFLSLDDPGEKRHDANRFFSSLFPYL